MKLTYIIEEHITRDNSSYFKLFIKKSLFSFKPICNTRNYSNNHFNNLKEVQDRLENHYNDIKNNYKKETVKINTQIITKEIK